MGTYEGLTVILPTFNEGGNIQCMLDALTSQYPEASVIVADDNSSDGTHEIVQGYSSKNGRVSLLARDPADRGLTASIMEGILNVRTEHFVVMDADFQHPPGSVGDLYTALRSGAQMVIGVRKDKDELSFGRMLASWGANTLALTYLTAMRRPRTKDTMSGFFGGRTDLCRDIIASKGERFERAGFKVLFDLLKFLPKDVKVAEVNFDFNTRRSGESKLSSRVILSILRQCGIAGRFAALAVNFLLINMLGRFLSALGLGLAFTFWVMGPGYVGGEELITSTVLAFVLAMAYLVVANKYLLTHGRRDGMVLGVKLVFTAFSGYLVNMYIFNMAFSSPISVQTWPMFMGFGIAYLWNTFSSALPEN